VCERRVARPSSSQHECAVAPVYWTPTCASRPRTTCSIRYCRKQRGPPSGRTQLSRPAVVRPGTLRAGILAGRRHLFSLVLLGPLTHAVYTSPDLVSIWDKDPATAAPSSSPAPVSTPWPAVVRTPRMKSRRPTTLLALQHSAVPPPVAPVAQGRSHRLLVYAC
jgi:hypothetical protein